MIVFVNVGFSVNGYSYVECTFWMEISREFLVFFYLFLL